MEKVLYNKLVERKKSGEKLNWNDITKEELNQLWEEYAIDNMIADLYDVTKSQVAYKRRKWGISIKNSAKKEIQDMDCYKKLNLEMKNSLLSGDGIDTISIALTHYLFRSGPVEDMHAEGKLSQEDMKLLNKFMVNRITGLLETIKKDEWVKLALLLKDYCYYGRELDKPEPDTEEIEFAHDKLFIY